ncbi:MAG: presqualene diphosphate synthase HpnD [Rhizobiales bacterium]|nr:presqualene diphosphate synthase HpnD [Hyphomicrobiales bacterium]
MSTSGHVQAPATSSAAAERRKIAKQVRKASTSFYWAMRLLPKERRHAIFAVYAFCRQVDDIADDDGMSVEDRRAGLSTWRREIDQLYIDQPEHPISKALLPAVAKFDLEKSDLIAVIDGMEMDLGTPIRAPQRPTFDLYCDRVACAVGRMCVKIFGEPGERGRILADTQGRALQITNILRDVHEDAERDRLYLPLELLESRGIFLTRPKEVIAHPAFASAWRTLASEAAGWYQKSELAMASCNPQAMKPARIMLEVYRANLERMRALSDAEISNPHVSKRLVSKPKKLLIALRYGLM